MGFTKGQLVSQLAQTKHYTWIEYINNRFNYIPTSGEICVIQIPSHRVDSDIPDIYKSLPTETYLLKIGNGTQNLKSLPWVDNVSSALNGKTFILDCND